VSLYLVSYDLLNHATFGQYEELIAEIQRLGGQRVLLSEWVMRRTDTPSALRDHLRTFMHTADRILVSEITTNWASWNILCDINKV
jgi:endonuclease/exonuclease/phosphatase (EEP) superfamily protein YafD